MTDISSPNNSLPKRRFTRFRPDPGDVAEIDFGPLDRPFRKQIVGLIVEESPMGGCGLILMEHSQILPGAICRIKLGKLAPLRAEIRWCKNIQPEIIRVGCRFLE